MVGTVYKEQPVGSIEIGVAGDDSAGQERIEVPTLSSGASCSSCGARIEHDAALCPWCGRVAVKDPVFDSKSAPDALPLPFGPRFARTGLIDVVLETRGDSTWP